MQEPPLAQIVRARRNRLQEIGARGQHVGPRLAPNVQDAHQLASDRKIDTPPVRVVEPETRARRGAKPEVIERQPPRLALRGSDGLLGHEPPGLPEDPLDGGRVGAGRLRAPHEPIGVNPLAFGGVAGGDDAQSDDGIRRDAQDRCRLRRRRGGGPSPQNPDGQRQQADRHQEHSSRVETHGLLTASAGARPPRRARPRSPATRPPGSQTPRPPGARPS